MFVPDLESNLFVFLDTSNISVPLILPTTCIVCELSC